MSIPNVLQSLRDRGLRITDRLSALAPLLIRLTLGLVFITSGWGKLHGLADVTAFFQTLNIPFPALNAAVVASTEFVGGLLVLAGLGTRLAALPLAFTMVIAILTAKRGEIDGLATLAGFVETGYLVMFLALVIIGPGAISLDSAIGRWRAQRGAPAPILSQS